MHALLTRSCLTSLRPFARVAVAIGMLGSAAACGQSALHSSHGHRLAAVQAAQLGAHPAREPIVRGDEAARNIGLYYSTLDGTAQGGNTGGGSALPGMQTAGVPPLH